MQFENQTAVYALRYTAGFAAFGIHQSYLYDNNNDNDGLFNLLKINCKLLFKNYQINHLEEFVDRNDLVHQQLTIHHYYSIEKEEWFS